MTNKIDLKLEQEIVYGIFKDFDRVCKKYNIKYSMEGGTLLGAVKFGDFVPWDDDVDIVMLRDEYEKFLKVAPSELSSEYFLQSYNNVREYPLNYAKICYRKSQINNYYYTHLKNMCHGIFIDIFPIDNVIPAKMKNQIHRIGLLTGARKMKLKVELANTKKWKKMLYKIVGLLPMKVLCKLLNHECTKYNKYDTGYCYEICNSNTHFKPLPSNVYNDITNLKFRDGEFYAVKEYDKFLKSRFGENYMSVLPPEEERKPSHNQNITISTKNLF